MQIIAQVRKEIQMAQSLAKNYIHIVFSTKNRENTMKKEDLIEIFSYIAGIIKNSECNSICVGSTTNHIHILCTLNKSLALSKLVATIKAKIQGIELQKPMLSTWYIHNQFAALCYCQQVLNLLVEDFASGFSKIEAYKHKLTDELQRGNGNYSYALWIASDILRHLRFSVDYAIAFDQLPHCDMLISHVRDEVIKGVSRSANNATIELMGTVLSLAFKIKDINDIG